MRILFSNQVGRIGDTAEEHQSIKVEASLWVCRLQLLFYGAYYYYYCHYCDDFDATSGN